MEEELFSLYYINLEKVYELRMIRNNLVQENRILENKLETNSSDSINANLSSGIKGIISADLSAKSSLESLKSVKVSDTFTVKQTKSNILADILEMADGKQDWTGIEDGSLIRIDNIKLHLENEQIIRLFKVLSRDIIRGQAANGVDINRALNSLAKDYSYLLSATFCGKNIVIKIPMTAEGEFENRYSIDDLLIGNVSIIGVYKGTVKGDELNSTFDFFASLNSNGLDHESEEEIQSSSNDIVLQPYNLSTTIQNEDDYIFIDLLAVVQNIKVKEKGSKQETIVNNKKKCIFKRLFRRRNND